MTADRTGGSIPAPTTDGSRQRHHLVATTVWCAGLVVLARVLWVLGHGSLAPPPLSGWADLDRWLQERTPVTAAFALLRIVALAVVAYLLVLTALALAARLLRLPGLLRAVEVTSIPAVRRALTTVAGVGLGASTTLVAVTPGIGVAGARPAAITARPRTEAAAAGNDRLVIEQVRLAPLVLEEVRPAIRPASPQRAPATAAATVSAPAPPAPPAPTVPTAWTVRPGDHLWSIAEAHLSAMWGRPLTDAEIGPYWRTLLDANRPTLPDPSNPDLLFAGAVLTLPPAPADPTAIASRPSGAERSVPAPVPSAPARTHAATPATSADDARAPDAVTRSAHDAGRSPTIHADPSADAPVSVPTLHRERTAGTAARAPALRPATGDAAEDDVPPTIRSVPGPGARPVIRVDETRREEDPPPTISRSSTTEAAAPLVAEAVKPATTDDP